MKKVGIVMGSDSDLPILEKSVDNWADYAREIIWFGKRRSATLCTNSRENITVEYKD